jgi:hypothetical protein
MALSPNPLASTANPFAGLPSYSGSDASVNQSGSTLLGGAGQGNNYIDNRPGAGQAQINAMGLSGVRTDLTGLGDKLSKDPRSIAAITSKVPSPSFVNPQAKLVATLSTKFAEEAAAAAPGNAASKAKVDSLVNKLGGGVSSGLNGTTAGILSKIPSAAGENSLMGGASLLGSGQSAYSGVANLDGLGSSIKNAAGGAVNSITGALGGLGGLGTLANTVSNAGADVSGILNKLGGGNLAGGIMGAAGKISATAGMLGNILSMKRGANLPSGGEMFASTGPGISVEANSAEDWRVRISANWALFGDGNPMIDMLKKTGGVVWPYLPNITVSTKANYSQVDLLHSNYPHQGYKNSQVDEIQISGEFSCEHKEDAAYWIAANTFFKTATKMFFGTGDNAGSPPIICRLNGYGANIFNNVPVVVKSYSVDLKDDVNYIKCDAYGNNTWVPALSTVTVTVMPIYNRENLRKFNLKEYAKGAILTNGAGYI